ncbi:MAG TPA: c-type cytochrome [Ramlibacter sp.]|nr:c-type cytochrome [Ramlibacter sp.]
MRMQAQSVSMRALLPAIVLFTLSASFSGTADAQRKERQGKEVVDAVCGACHTSGKDGAPRIGDANAWSSRASQGLTALTAHAISGIRKMPAHGGSTGVSDVEIERAITYMVNRSGGNWVEPLQGTPAVAASTSEAIVKAQCAQCHEAGKDGAPKIGDRTAWTPRLAKGLDSLVASAIHGHGPMPARGGMPDLTDQQIRGAILYMFSYGLPAIPPQPPVAAADPHHKLVSGIDVYFGMMRAEAMRAAQAQDGKSGGTKVDIPPGTGYYHLNVALADNKSKAPVTDAKVTMQVSDGMTVQSKTLNLVAANNAVSYGNFFRFSSGSAYNITTEIQRPGAGPVVAKFEFKAP